MLRHVLNPVMARMSSKLLAATSKVGMPFSTPYPFSCRSSMEGTTIAGETAPSTKLKQRHGKLTGKHPFTKERFTINSEYVNLYNNSKSKDCVFT